MMSEKPAGTPNKQKIVATIVVIVFVIIIWQVIGLFKGGSSQRPASVVTPTQAKTAQTGAMMANKPESPNSAVPAAVVNTNELPVVPVSKEMEFYKMQQEAQQKYISSLNELQSLRIQKEIAETNQAIAAAKLATVTAEKNVADLLTKPVQPPSNPFGASSIGAPPAKLGETVPAPSTSEEAPYAVISVSMELNRWKAVIAYQAKPYEVSVGTVLPPDGSTVVGIDTNGVTLQRAGKRRTIPLVGGI